MAASVEGQDVFWENEINANKVTTIGCLFFAGAVFLTLLLSELHIFIVYKLGDNYEIHFLMAVSLCAVSGVAIHYKYQKVWIKYMLMIVLILVMAVADMIFTYSVSILIVIPVVFSSRYFSSKYTVIVALVTFVVFFISTILGVFYGDIDFNNVVFPKDTVINLGEEVYLIDAYEVNAIDYDLNYTLLSTLIYRLLPDLMQAFVVFAACLVMSIQGRRAILRQKEMTHKQTMVEADLSFASKIQRSVLPNEFPAFPDHDEFDLYASMTPAKLVGGDFYDYFLIDNDHLFIDIADVSGKGIPAAMFMMRSKNIIKNLAHIGKTPASILTAANKTINADNSELMFVTVWAGILELSTGRLIAANAGHEQPVLIDSEGRARFIKGRHGFVLGAMAEEAYTDYEIILDEGAMLFLYTDGIVEAKNSDKKMFGRDGVLKTLDNANCKDPREVLTKVQKSVEDFVKDAEQFDDMTMLCLRYK